jgi:hypothetical protein
MVLYGLALTPLADAIRTAVPHSVQPWYADDSGVVGNVTALATAQRLLLELGPKRGYFPEPSKSILITPLDAPPSAFDALDEFNFQKSIVTSADLLVQEQMRLLGLIHKSHTG